MSDSWVPAEVVGDAVKRPVEVSQLDDAPRRRPRGGSDLGMAVLFIIPAAIGFLFFYLYPSIRGLYFSLTKYNLLGSPHFIGFDNYTRLISDKLFWNALLVTVEYVLINIGLQTILAVGIAVLMHRLTQSTAIRGLILMPFLISNVIAALLWFWLLDYQVGLVNEFISAIGLNKIAFFGDGAWAIPTIALVNVWRHMGYTAPWSSPDCRPFPPTCTRRPQSTAAPNGAHSGGSPCRCCGPSWPWCW